MEYIIRPPRRVLASAPLFISSVVFILICLLLPTPIKADENEVIAGLKEHCAKLASINDFSLRIASQSTMDSSFVAHNPKYAQIKYNSISERYVIYLHNDLFKINYSGSYGDGSKLPDVKGVFDGVSTMWSFATEFGINARIRKGADHIPDNVAILGTALFLPFSFLAEPGPHGQPSIITPQSLKVAISKLAERVAFEGTFDSKKASLRVSSANGCFYIVDIDIVNGYFPTSVKLFNEKGNLLFLFRSISLHTVDNGTSTIPYAREFVFESFLNGCRLAQRHVIIEAIEVKENINVDNFELDISSCDSIWDEDNKVKIKIPR